MIIKMSVSVKVRREEHGLDKALRKLKRIMDDAGVLKELKDRRYFEKPSVKRRKKKARALSRARKEAADNKRGII